MTTGEDGAVRRSGVGCSLENGSAMNVSRGKKRRGIRAKEERAERFWLRRLKEVGEATVRERCEVVPHAQKQGLCCSCWPNVPGLPTHIDN